MLIATNHVLCGDNMQHRIVTLHMEADTLVNLTSTYTAMYSTQMHVELNCIISKFGTDKLVKSKKTNAQNLLRSFVYTTYIIPICNRSGNWSHFQLPLLFISSWCIKGFL